MASLAGARLLISSSFSSRPARFDDVLFFPDPSGTSCVCRYINVAICLMRGFFILAVLTRCDSPVSAKARMTAARRRSSRRRRQRRSRRRTSGRRRSSRTSPSAACSARGPSFGRPSAWYYFSAQNRVYVAKLPELALHCNQCSDGVVLDRIGRLFDVIVVDEAQDMAGYDFDFISGLIKSGVEIVVCGDEGQTTYLSANGGQKRIRGGLGEKSSWVRRSQTVSRSSRHFFAVVSYSALIALKSIGYSLENEVLISSKIEFDIPRK